MDSIATNPAGTQPAERALEEALNLSSDGVIVYQAVRDEAGRITDYTLIALNDIATEIFGMKRHELSGIAITRLWPGIDQDDVWPQCARVVETRQAYHTEVHRTTPAGDSLWLDVTLRPYGDGFAKACRDITAVKEALLHAEKQKLFYEELLQQSSSRKAILSAVYGGDGDITDFRYEYANYGKGIDDAHRRLPYFDKDIAGMLATELLPFVKQTPVWDFYLRVVTTGAPARTQLWYYGDGIDAAVDLTGKRLEDSRILITYTDISEAQRLALALEAETSRLDAVFQAVPLGLTVFEAVRDETGTLKDLRLVRLNEKALQLSRIPATKYVPGALLSELMPKELYDNFEHMLTVVRSGEPLVHELYQPQLGIWISSRVMKHGDGLLNTIQDITAIKSHGSQMQQQAQLLEGVLQASPHAILVFEAMRNTAGRVDDFRIVRFNRQATIATGMPGEELGGTTLFTCMPSVRSRLQQYMAVIESGEPETYEFFNEKLGLWRRITNSSLGADGFVMTMEDITEQKQISQKIEETARLLNAVLDASPIAIVVYEAVRNAGGDIEDFRPIIANIQAVALSGLSARAFLGMTYFQRVPGSRDSRLPPLTAVVTERKTERFEHQVASSGIWVNSITTPFGDGFIATAQDVTAQKEQSRIIEEQATLFNGVLSSLQNGLSIFRIIRDEAGELEDLMYLQIADSVERDTGRTRGETIGKSIRALYPGIEQTEYWGAYAALARSGKPQHFETHFTLHGYDNYLLNWITPIGTDKLASVYYIVNDLKQAQRKLEYTVQELSRSNADLEQFAAIASHDLQEPLRKVQSFGAMLETRHAEALGESGKDLVKRMQNAAGRMRNLVSGLLSFARLSGDEEQPLSPVDLHGLIHEIITDLDQTMESAGGTVQVTGRLPFVLGIDGQLRHLFHNLLTNALKFRKKDVAPIVVVSAGPLREDDVARLSPAAIMAQYVRIQVRDNGIGFEPEYAEKIFGLFERLHGMNEYQGTGIGLSISRRVAERHLGIIRAESTPGEGATFIVLLQQA